nr:MAG: RNA-dependent RNA polymerase [Riboviria sp.]
MPPTYTHNGCVCNEYIGFVHRHQKGTPEVKGYVGELLREALNGLHDLACLEGNGLKFQLVSRWKVVNSYKGRHYKRYYKALLELNERGLLDRDFWNRAFIKPDKEDKMVVEVANAKPPRLVQYMMATGALEMGRYTHAAETAIYALRDEYDTKIFGKGCNLHELAEDFVEKTGHFSQPVYLLLDASSFDAHVSSAVLKIVASWYATTLPDKGEARFVRWLWSHTYTNIGMSVGGIRFKTQGTRMSGHMDTGLGNSLIMFAMIKSFLKTVGINKHTMSVNGDDSVVIIERNDLRKAQNMSFFTDCGFKMKFEWTEEFSQMEYCQCKPVETRYGWVMARSPDRILRRAGWSTKRFGKKRVADYLFSLGMGECAINYGLPIGYALGTKLKQTAIEASNRPVKMLPINRKKYISYTRQKYWQSPEPAVVDDIARNSYAEAWGITPDDQIEIENRLKILLAPALDNSHQIWYHDNVDGLLIGSHPE